MKKSHIILLGVAGAAAAVIGGTLVTGDGFSLGSMASVSGILAEAETIQETETATEDVASNVAYNNGEALIAGTYSIDEASVHTEPEEANAQQSEAAEEAQAAGQTTVYNTVTYNTVTYETVSAPDSASAPTVKVSEKVVEDTSETPEREFENAETEVIVRLGCASHSEPVYDENGDYIGSKFFCSCGAYEIYDIDGNLIYSREESDYEISEDEIMTALKEKAGIEEYVPDEAEYPGEVEEFGDEEYLKDSFEEEETESGDVSESENSGYEDESDYTEEDGEVRLGCASACYLIFDDNEEEIGVVSECYTCEIQDVFDNEGENVHHADGLENFLSDEEAAELLK